MPRFFVENLTANAEKEVVLGSDSVHHAMRVLRLREGDSVQAFNGKGYSISGPIHFAKDFASILVENESTEVKPIEITLLQAVVKNEKSDWIVEKACELGVSKIVFFPAARSEIKLSEEKKEKRLDRWKKIAVSACQQCYENFLPEIVLCSSYTEALSFASGLKLVLSPHLTAQSLPSKVTDVSFLIGPEGGLSEGEINNAVASGFIPAKLGNRVLRTETAGIAAASFAQTLWGDFKI